MKMTNAQMAADIDAMTGLQETGKLGYAIARNLRKMKEECTEYLQIRSEAYQKYGEDMGNGKVRIPADKIPLLKEDTDEIAQIEHDVDVYQIPEDVFFSGNLTNSQMENLLWMVEEDD